MQRLVGAFSIVVTSILTKDSKINQGGKESWKRTIYIRPKKVAIGKITQFNFRHCTAPLLLSFQNFSILQETQDLHYASNHCNKQWFGDILFVPSNREDTCCSTQYYKLSFFKAQSTVDSIQCEYCTEYSGRNFQSDVHPLFPFHLSLYLNVNLF